jgi:large subunit ribosomal protein L25
MEFITIDVNRREDLGSANASRLRRSGHVPAVLYGLNRPTITLAIEGKQVERFLKTGSYLVELRLGDKARPAILREIQYDEVTDQMLHLDFNRVDADTPVETAVPVHFKGRAKGESEGGVFQSLMPMITISARPKDLPRHYTVDISDMAVGAAIHLSDLEAREGVVFSEPMDSLVAHCVMPKAVAEEVGEGEEEEEVVAEA